MPQTETFAPNSPVKPFSVASRLRRLALPVSILVVFALAIYLRFYLLVLHGGLQDDQIGWAQQFHFGGISVAYIWLRDALLAGRVEPIWIYMPGYPALLAILDLLGFHDLRSVRIVQTVLDAAAIVPLFYVVKRLTRSGVLALLAAGIYAIAPWWALGASYLMAESLLPALVICALAGMMWVGEHQRSAMGWFAIGLICATLPFFRSEMVLLAGALVLWAAFAGLPGRRLSMAVIAGTAFITPVLAWCLRNYLVNNQFFLVPPMQWYALWSGLGQIPNDFGYVASDFNAMELLKARGIGWHTPASEALWKAEYLRAWSDHPYHVLKSILFRMRLILTSCDYGFVELFGLCNAVYSWFAWSTLLALMGLLWKRRWAEAFIVAGPMLYAMASLGFIYVEPRYVRYAGLTYVLGFPVLLALITQIISENSRTHAQLGDSEWLKAGMGAAGLVVVCVYLAGQRASLAATEYDAIVSLLPRSSAAVRPDITLQSLSFEAARPTVSVSMKSSGLEVDDRERSLSYLTTAALSSDGADALLIRSRVQLVDGDLMMGILSRDQRSYLGRQVITGPAGSIQSSELQSSVQSGSRIVLHAHSPAQQGSRFQVQSLDISLLCLEGPVEFPPFYLLGRQLPRVGPCNRGGSMR